MKYLPFLTLISLAFVLLTTSCIDDDSEALLIACSDPVKIGDNFDLNGNSVTVLKLHSDKWCACCKVCNCFSAPSALLLVEGDSVRVGGEFASATMMPHTGEYNGRTITMEDLEDGTCENRLDSEDISACFSIE